VYANGAQDISDSVLGVQIINGTGVLLNFGGQVIKNVAGYDVARLLVGSKGQLTPALIYFQSQFLTLIYPLI
jgi:glycolate oxidase FAD binding subunit